MWDLILSPTVLRIFLKGPDRLLYLRRRAIKAIAFDHGGIERPDLHGIDAVPKKVLGQSTGISS
jgi:hypothetical protein